MEISKKRAMWLKQLREGELNAIQRQIVKGLSDGKQHAQIAKELGWNRVTIAENAAAAVFKTGCVNTNELMFVYGQRRAFTWFAGWLDSQLIKQPLGDAETHFNECIRDMAAEIRDRGAKLRGSAHREGEQS
jgi:hypothetical protein